MQEFSIYPDEVLINSILDGCEKAQEYEKGKSIFEYFKKLQINIPCMSFSIMMKVDLIFKH
jgi:pentatricopeptide repeat protein